MNEQTPNPPAFPTIGENYPYNDDCTSGMTLRDYFAARAMQGFIASSSWAIYEEMVPQCYEIADAMLKERTKHQ